MKLVRLGTEAERALALLYYCNETRSPLQIWPDLLCRDAERLVQ